MPKKLIASLFAILSFLSVADTNRVNILMVLWRGDTPAEIGFKQQLNNYGYDVWYTVFDAKQNRDDLVWFVQSEIKPNLKYYDYIYTFGTTVSSLVKQRQVSTVPQLFMVVSDPVKAGLVKSLAEPVGGNITGTTSSVSLYKQLYNAKKLLAFTKVGFLFNPRELNSQHISNKLFSLQSELGFEVKRFRIKPDKEASINDFNIIMTKIVNTGINTVYLSSDSFLLSKRKLIAQSLIAHKLKSIASEEAFVLDGALLGTVASYEKLGQQAADIIHKHQQGEKIANMKVVTPQQVKFIINANTLKKIGLEVNPSQLKDVTFIGSG
ncbi:ABC transporter substrate-binding protein [Endozoicomonas sp. SM1973]|uniref:ABC transporter substrate-binding protein n=1 Tax=Spartinivicinus marinus TaxID=2994442 RepID=A0A853I172_9GAMM|nr:ABC transporter substrate-binding protein [Spartinivicinus marinus]MCX4028584.1 ABC transporter substrate-binding protein [Spartinivicinus marinus]NYZ67153.1 ABC transporter substrate-binding protein [Spartinivicinus marinus]